MAHVYSTAVYSNLSGLLSGGEMATSYFLFASCSLHDSVRNDVSVNVRENAEVAHGRFEACGEWDNFCCTDIVFQLY